MMMSRVAPIHFFIFVDKDTDAALRFNTQDLHVTPYPKKSEVVNLAKKKKELTKEERIKNEIKRLNKIYKNVDEDNKSIIDGLIKRAAFMLVQLEEYEQDLNKNGYIEMFTQSEKTAPYERERPTARLYSTLQKNYATTIKQLSELLPKPQNQKSSEQDNDGFEDFVGDRDD